MKASDFPFLNDACSIKSFLAWVRTFRDEGKFPMRSFEKKKKTKTGISDLALFIIY